MVNEAEANLSRRNKDCDDGYDILVSGFKSTRDLALAGVEWTYEQCKTGCVIICLGNSSCITTCNSTCDVAKSVGEEPILVAYSVAVGGAAISKGSCKYMALCTYHDDLVCSNNYYDMCVKGYGKDDKGCPCK